MSIKIAMWTIVTLVAIAAFVVIVGYLLPKDHVASAEAVIDASPSQVYPAIADVARYAEWRKDVSKVEVLSASPLRWKEHGWNGVITYEVVEQRPPARLVGAIADPTLPFGGTWTYELTPAGSGTRVRITERGEVRNPVYRFMSRFVFSQTATMEKFLAALGKRVSH